MENAPILTITEHSTYKTWRKGMMFAFKKQPAFWLVYGGLLAFWLWQIARVIQGVLHDGFAWQGLVPFLLLLVVFVVFLFVVFPRSLYRNSAAVTTTNFYENHFQLQAARRNTTLNATKYYDQINKAYETNDAFCLKHGKVWHIFSKHSMTDDQIAILHELFARALGENFMA
ncbi:MAG: YcxB family protein [Oscillospiraceae bacterium]|nr:YcxB family protein [Oscillospiraceae bacterium]